MKSGELTRLFLIRNWLRGRGGDEIDFEELTEDYKRRKASGSVLVGKKGSGSRHGGAPIPNLLLTGAMQKGLFVKSISKAIVRLGFRSEQQSKALGNQKIRNGMMLVSNRWSKVITEFISKQLLRR